MASDNDEDDYMSAMFLEEPEDLKNKELSYVEKRKKTLREQQKKAYIKPRKVLEEEARQEGLQKELDEKNKGMKMLMKMGFKYGHIAYDIALWLAQILINACTDKV
jgi:hypothetical protein